MHVHAHASEGVGGNALVPLNKSGNLVIVISIFCHQIIFKCGVSERYQLQPSHALQQHTMHGGLQRACHNSMQRSTQTWEWVQ